MGNSVLPQLIIWQEMVEQAPASFLENGCGKLTPYQKSNISYGFVFTAVFRCEKLLLTEALPPKQHAPSARTKRSPSSTSWGTAPLWQNFGRIWVHPRFSPTFYTWTYRTGSRIIAYAATKFMPTDSLGIFNSLLLSGAYGDIETMSFLKMLLPIPISTWCVSN